MNENLMKDIATTFKEEKDFPIKDLNQLTKIIDYLQGYADRLKAEENLKEEAEKTHKERLKKNAWYFEPGDDYYRCRVCEKNGSILTFKYQYDETSESDHYLNKNGMICKSEVLAQDRFQEEILMRQLWRLSVQDAANYIPGDSDNGIGHFISYDCEEGEYWVNSMKLDDQPIGVIWFEHYSTAEAVADILNEGKELPILIDNLRKGE